MVKNTRWVSVSILFILIFTLGTVQIEAESDARHPFSGHLDYLYILNVLPERQLSPQESVKYLDYFIYIEQLFNGRKSPIYDLSGKIEIPEGQLITYQDALSIAGMFLGYNKESSYTQVQDLTQQLKKSALDPINGYEMAYIFYTLLYTQRNGSFQTVIEERYLVGSDELVASRVMQITDGDIVLEDHGRFPLANNLQTFIVKDEKYKPSGFSSVAVGMKNLKFLFNESGEVQTILIKENKLPEKIRVLLSQNLNKLGGSLSYDFDSMMIKATQPFKIITREKGVDQVILVAETGEVVNFSNSNGLIRVVCGTFETTVSNRIYLKSYYNHSINFDPLLSTPRQQNIPVYAGILEIMLSNTPGYLYLVNELPMEVYLKRVVSSQIPLSWGKEAFKVQAVAARSYAMMQMTRAKFNDKSANIDDSNASQLYNAGVNIDHPDLTAAIDETRGIVATYYGNVIDAVFFSTSGGHTANNEEVWHNDRTKEFPGTPIPYLRAKSQVLKPVSLDLTKESHALVFFKNSDVEAYDSASPYYRWRIVLSREELENTISKNLPLREKADQALGTDFVQTIEGEPIDLTIDQFSIGTLKELRVAKRGEGGNIMVLDIISTNGTYRVMKEYNIRFLIRPTKEMTGSEADVILYRNDGSTIANYSILPSAFAVFEPSRDSNGELERVIIYGGGNGHGVGISQWAIRGMVHLGYTYEEILKNFYTDIELEKVY